MEEELQRNWTVIGDENATKLQQRWVRIIEKQMDIAAYKLDLIQDIFDIINPQANLFLSDFRSIILNDIVALIKTQLKGVFDFMKILYLIKCVVCRLGFIIVALKQLKGILEIVHVIRHDKAFAVISVY
ncbi:hypothetical protein SASPL_129862 [Salvia splendens]|uniref:Uncharacterized protein n=1 Tax=Salvia splendens TaxID=180675 RepID=A0A8X8ZP38_SALSN|nr:hypothetical protein SASPL_129862 [Salvia splendens]